MCSFIKNRVIPWQPFCQIGLRFTKLSGRFTSKRVIRIGLIIYYSTTIQDVSFGPTLFFMYTGTVPPFFPRYVGQKRDYYCLYVGNLDNFIKGKHAFSFFSILRREIESFFVVERYSIYLF